ncbi:MAG: hypothetical protein M3274_04790 [Actinomycetota bacterium]|jgi:hypothetical protein|nr:hypothetical protein [Actinomycetota bacterium]
MREVRVTSLERFEATDGEVRILANSGYLALVFPREVWERALSETISPQKPTPEEIEELLALKQRLKEHARENSFATALEEVPCGDSDSDYQLDLVLRPAGMLAVTTGYLFLPVVRAEHMARLRTALEEDGFVEGAYLVGAVAEEGALAAGDEGLKALSVRGRRCSSSRFELAPELWQVLAERGWDDLKPVAPVGINQRRED